MEDAADPLDRVKNEDRKTREGRVGSDFSMISSCMVGLVATGRAEEMVMRQRCWRSVRDAWHWRVFSDTPCPHQLDV